MFFQHIIHKLRNWRNPRNFTIWYDSSYRLPITSLGMQHGLEPRRSDFALWYLFDVAAIHLKQIHKPPKLCFKDIARVHSCEYLESLTQPKTLSELFAVEPWDIPVDELLHSIRLASGGTVAAAQHVLKNGGTALNLLGGFHHASPKRGGPLCPINDIAIAVAKLRDEGFEGQINIIDLDAHPPDGIADCLGGEAKIWIGSLSAADWGELKGVNETLLATDCDDKTYLKALEKLLGEMPIPEISFVIAGGDVIAGDKMGGLALSLEGAKQRDLRVFEALQGLPSVWIPGGGYQKESWKVLAATGMILSQGSTRKIPDHYNPLRKHFRKIANQLDDDDLEGEEFMTQGDIDELFGLSPYKSYRMLDYYTANGIEYALYQYGIFDYMRRLGYHSFKISLDRNNNGHRLRVFGKSEGKKELLLELVLEKQVIEKTPMLYIHWFNLRNPRSEFSEQKPQLPGQETPGLGLAKESSELFYRIAKRLDLKGIAFRPAWYHIAYAMRYRFQFIDPIRQARFEGLQRDLGHIQLLKLTTAISEKKVKINGEIYSWESELMAFWVDLPFIDRKRIEEEKRKVSFSLFL